MENYLFNEERNKQLLREAENERLVRIIRANNGSKPRYNWDFSRLRALWGWWKESPVQIQTAPTPIANVNQVPCNCPG